jgi:hypothetical protein
MAKLESKLKNLDERIAKSIIEKDQLLKDAVTSNDVEAIYKAQEYLQLQKKNNLKFDDKGKALLIDPFHSSNLGYYDKRSVLSFDILRNMAKSPIVNAIIATRKEQTAEYCIPQQDKYSKGFIIRKKSIGIENDENKDLDEEDKAKIDEITEFILQCGENEENWFADDFESFARKLVEDSLVLDQGAFEVVQTRVGKPYQFFAVDSGTIRIADTYDQGQSGAIKGGKKNGYYPSYVQVYQGTIIAEWYPWELGLGIRNPQTSIYANGYGRSELEELITTVTALLNSDSYNAKFFRNGTAPKGALLVKKASGLSPDVISEFRREWGGEMTGVDNMHKTPIFDAEHIEWLDLQKTNRDMEFSKYQEYLIKLACAMYKISPEEIGFSIQGSNKGLGNGRSGAKDDRKYSYDKGLKPLLKSFERWINHWIIFPLTDGEYEFKFVGMDAETSKDEEDRLVKAVASYMKVNEVREQKGLEQLPDEDGGNLILNPIISQQKMMQQGGGMMGGDQGYDNNDFNSDTYEPDWQAGGDEDNPMMKSLLDDFDKLVHEGK